MLSIVLISGNRALIVSSSKIVLLVLYKTGSLQLRMSADPQYGVSSGYVVSLFLTQVLVLTI